MPNPILTGAKVYSIPNMEANYKSDVIGKNSEVFAVGDPVTISSGVLKVVAAATDPIVGVATKAQTMASTNQTVAKVTPLYIPIDQSMEFLMGSNGDFAGNATDPGTFYGLTGATGAVKVNQTGGVTTTTSRQVVIVQVDPFGLGGTGSGSGVRMVIVKFVDLLQSVNSV